MTRRWPVCGLLAVAALAGPTGVRTQTIIVGGSPGLERPTDPPKGTGLILGRVIDGDSDRPVAGAVVTFGDLTSEISGTLSDASGRPANDYFILVFPADRTKWTSTNRRRIVQVRPATNGQFVVRNLQAGEYLVAALTDVEPGQMYDPAFLAQVAPSALKVTLAEGEKKVQNFQIK